MGVTHLKLISGLLRVSPIPNKHAVTALTAAFHVEGMNDVDNETWRRNKGVINHLCGSGFDCAFCVFVGTTTLCDAFLMAHVSPRDDEQIS